MRLNEVLIIIAFIIGVCYGSEQDLINRWPQRGAAIDTLKILASNHNQTFDNYRIYLDNPLDFPDKWFLIEVAQKKIDHVLSDEELLSKIKRMESDIYDQVRDYLDYFSRTTPMRFFETDQPNMTLIPMVFFTIDHDISPRGYAITYTPNISDPSDTMRKAVVFEKDYDLEVREWIVLHELMHALFRMKHDSDGKPVSKLPIGDLDTSNSVVLYEEGSTYKAPGSLDDDLVYLGEYDWSVAQWKGNLTNPQGSNIHLHIDGIGVRRGSPGPMEWFEKISIGPDSSKIPDFFLTWIENFRTINKVYSNAYPEWHERDTYGFFPFIDKYSRELWTDLWNFDEARIHLVPGRTELSYRSDKVKGPSFNPLEEDTPLWVRVQNVPYVDAKLYGFGKRLELTNIDEARIELGSELLCSVKGLDKDNHFIKFSDNVTPRCTSHGSFVVWEWNTTNSNNQTLCSQALFEEIDSCDLDTCGGSGNMFGDCSHLSGRTSSTKGATISTMYMPVAGFGLIFIFLILAICCCGCCICLIGSGLIICVIACGTAVILVVIVVGCSCDLGILLFAFRKFFRKAKKKKDEEEDNDFEMGPL